MKIVAGELTGIACGGMAARCRCLGSTRVMAGRVAPVHLFGLGAEAGVGGSRSWENPPGAVAKNAKGGRQSCRTLSLSSRWINGPPSLFA